MHLPRRFDGALMRAPDARGPVDAALIATLRTWCEGGAFPTLAEPLRAASIAPGAGQDAVACALDGSLDLARLGRRRGLRWRLEILWREQVAGHSAQPGDPWGCDWWRDGPLGPAEVFRPRRATFMMLREPAPAAASALLARLRARSPSYARPLRVLMVSAVPMAGMARLELGTLSISRSSTLPERRASRPNSFVIQMGVCLYTGKAFQSGGRATFVKNFNLADSRAARLPRACAPRLAHGERASP